MSSIDPYSLCPGGTGKKLKFCCHDLVGELGQIQNMLEGGQRQACLDHIESLEKKHPDRACLVTTRALLESALGNDAKAATTLEGFLAKNPNNPVALAEQALVYAAQRGATAGIEPLQRALECDDDQIAGRVVMAVSRLGEMLLMEGQPLAARGHFLLAFALHPEDRTTLELLARFFAAPQLPLLLKNDQSLQSAPVDAPWRAEHDAAVEEARRGRWWRAADRLKRIANDAPTAPVVWRNLAILRSWLADAAGATAALRKFASLDVPCDDAVEAEALAQLIDPTAPEDVVDELRATFEVDEFDRLAETLAGDKRVAAFQWQSLGLDFGDQPPPRSGYFLLDRPLPPSGVDLRREDVPIILGRLLLFGRQTDRAARVEAMVRRTDLDALRKQFGELVGNSARETGEPETIDQMPTAEAALSWSWRLPDDVPPAHVRALIDQQRRESILTGWAATPLKMLDGRRPLDAATDPALRIRTAGALLLVEQSFSQPTTDAVFAELRTKLGLPAVGPVEAPSDPNAPIPYTRLHRLVPEKLTDDQLARNFQRALQVSARAAVTALGTAITLRPSLKGKIDLAQVYGHLADMEGASDEAVKYLDLARREAEEQKQSTAQWDLDELELRLRRGEPHEFSRLIEHIQTYHLREPGVAQALMQMLYSAGIIGPDGRPRMPTGDLGPAAVAPSAAEPGKLWTPDSEAAPAGGTTQKSGLWIPGQ